MKTAAIIALFKVSPLVLVFMQFCGPLRAETGKPDKVEGKNVVVPDRWSDKFHTGDWKWEDGLILCDSKNNEAGRNCFQNGVMLNQETPLPIMVTVWNKAENVTRGYSLFIDFVCKGEGNATHGLSAPFPMGTHDWVRRRMVVIPARPLVQANLHLWFEHQPSGKVWYKDIDVHPLDSKATLADLEGITEESLKQYDKNTTKDIACVGLVGGEPDIIADIMNKTFNSPKDPIRTYFEKNLWYAEDDIILSCWAADLKKGDFGEFYAKKKKLSFNDFLKNEMQMDEAAAKSAKERIKQIKTEINDAKIKTMIALIEKEKAKYR